MKESLASERLFLSGSRNLSYAAIPRFVRVFCTFVISVSTVSCIFSNDSSSTPVFVSISLRVLSMSAMPPSDVSVNMAFRPSTEPNRLAIVSTFPPVAVFNSSRKPLNPLVCRAVTEKSIPNASAVFIASSVGLIMPLIAALSPDMDSAVLIPCAVSAATEDNSSSTGIPAEEAVGATRPIEAASSSNVVLPRFCVIRNLFASSSASVVAI